MITVELFSWGAKHLVKERFRYYDSFIFMFIIEGCLKYSNLFYTRFPQAKSWNKSYWFVFMILISECHWASWWISPVCHSGKISITSTSWHRSGWDNTRCAMHNRNAQFNQGDFKFNQRQGLSFISWSRFMHNGGRTCTGYGGIQGYCFLNNFIFFVSHFLSIFNSWKKG